MLSFYLAGLKKLFSIGKKVLLVIVVFFIVISLFLHFFNRDKPKLTYDPIKKNREEIYKTINDPKLLKTPQGKLTSGIIRFFTCKMVGEACTNNPNDANKNFDKSFFGLLTKLIATPLVNPPASGTMWVYNGLQNAGFIPKTYAATGIGFGSIKPLTAVWSALRDIAYLLLVLVIISIGFMIMFRMKLNPQTVISLENSLPKIVIALIIITFSFPIAGFLIDLMYVSIAIIVSTLGPAAGYSADTITARQEFFIAAGPWQLFEGINAGHYGVWAVMWDLPNALLNLVPVIGEAIKYVGFFIGAFFVWGWIFHNVVDPLAKFITSFAPAQFSASFFTLISATFDVRNFVEQAIKLPLQLFALVFSIMLAANVIIPLLIGVLILFTVIFIFFRLFFLLFSAYIKLLLYIAISPITLLLEAIPGQSAFAGWIRNLLSQLIVFPTIVALILFSVILMENASSGNLLQPPFLFGIDSRSFGLILGFFFLFMIPDVVKVVQQILVPKPGPLEQAAGIGVFFGGTKAGFEGGLSEISKYAGLGYYIAPLGNLVKKLTGGVVDPTKGIQHGGTGGH